MNHYEDWSFECSMCGKPMSYRYCGMCVSCEQIDNDVPDIPINQPEEPCYKPTERELAAGYDRWSHHGKCPICCADVQEHRGSHPLDGKWDYCLRCGWSTEVWR